MADFTGLTSTSFDRAYYHEHKAAGLDYLHYGDWQFRYARWLCDALQLPPAARILDIGCACGNLVQAFIDQHRAAAGIDANEYTIQLGRKRFPAIAAQLYICDASNLHPFPSDREPFELIHSMQSAEHWNPDAIPAILREFYRVAAADALLWFVLDTAELGTRQGRDLAAEDPTHRAIRPRQWWRDQLAAAGWQNCAEDYRSELTAHGWSYFDSHDWDWFLCRRAPQLSPLPIIRQGDWFIRAALAVADDAIVREVYHQDCYELRSRRRPSRAEETIVDVGACIGAFSRLAHAQNHRARVIAIEANPANIPALALNCPFAEIVSAALTYEPDPALLDSVWEGSANSGISQIHPAAAVRDYPADRYVRPAAHRPDTLTLEELFARHQLDRIDLLKLDCEGSEYSILENCQPETLDRIGEIVGEYHVSRERFEALLAARFPPADWQARYDRGPHSQGLFWLTRRN